MRRKINQMFGIGIALFPILKTCGRLRYLQRSQITRFLEMVPFGEEPKYLGIKFDSGGIYIRGWLERI